MPAKKITPAATAPAWTPQKKGVVKPPLMKTAERMQIEYVPRKSIKFWADNPRRNDQAAIDFAPLLAKEGMRSPLNVWKRDRVVYKGNTTLAALDIIHGHQDYDVPVILHDWETQEDANKYGIADNRIGENSEWDEDKLAHMMSQEKMKPLLTFTGFKTKEINALTWSANAARVDKIEETDEGMATVVKILCKPEDADSIRDVLAAWSKDCGYENVRIK
jgi:hypothetical protein